MFYVYADVFLFSMSSTVFFFFLFGPFIYAMVYQQIYAYKHIFCPVNSHKLTFSICFSYMNACGFMFSNRYKTNSFNLFKKFYGQRFLHSVMSIPVFQSQNCRFMYSSTEFVILVTFPIVVTPLSDNITRFNAGFWFTQNSVNSIKHIKIKYTHTYTHT